MQAAATVGETYLMPTPFWNIVVYHVSLDHSQLQAPTWKTQANPRGTRIVFPYSGCYHPSVAIITGGILCRSATEEAEFSGSLLD